MEKDIAKLLGQDDLFLIKLMNNLDAEEEIIYSPNISSSNYIYHKGRSDALKEIRDIYCNQKK